MNEQQLTELIAALREESTRHHQRYMSAESGTRDEIIHQVHADTYGFLASTLNDILNNTK